MPELINAIAGDRDWDASRGVRRNAVFTGCCVKVSQSKVDAIYRVELVRKILYPVTAHEEFTQEKMEFLFHFLE
jgi:hypothetical protein